MKSEKKKDTIRVPVSCTKNFETGKTTYNYQEVRTEDFAKWLQHCYELARGAS